MRRYGAALLGLGLMVGAAGQAAATTCTDIYASASSNGTETFPGTNVGTVGTAAGDVCQIGDLALYNGGSGGAFVNGTANPSNYEFFFDGGNLTIEEEVGNNGTAFSGIDVELDSLTSETSTSPLATLASMNIPYSSEPSPEYTLIDEDLAAGWYTLSSYLAGDGVGDPNYQANFLLTSVPEPSSLALLAVSLVGLAAFVRRRKA